MERNSSHSLVSQQDCQGPGREEQCWQQGRSAVLTEAREGEGKCLGRPRGGCPRRHGARAHREPGAPPLEGGLCAQLRPGVELAHSQCALLLLLLLLNTKDVL